jgi:hypothetical protein
MRAVGNRLDVVRRRLLSVRTVRLRLTALYGSLFLVSGAGLLAVTYVLVYHANGRQLRGQDHGGDAHSRGAPPLPLRTRPISISCWSSPGSRWRS